MRRHRGIVLAVGVLVACDAPPIETADARLPGGPTGTDTTIEQPPVAVNADVPVRYPPELRTQRIEGRVVLQLHVDEDGNVHPDSTLVAESSGHPALDSAAVAGAPALRFAPALRDGTPVATWFLQPIYFRAPLSEEQRP